jgi:hypothetical protein
MRGFGMAETDWVVFSVVPGLSLPGVEETAVEVTFKRFDGQEPHSCRLYFVAIDGRLECVGFAGGSTLGNTSLPFHPLDLASIRGVPWGWLIAEGKAQAAAMPGVLRSAIGREPLRPLTPAEEEEARAAGTPLLHLQGFSWLTDAEAAAAVAAMQASAAAALPETVPKRPGRPFAHGVEFYSRVAQIYRRECEAGNHRPTLAVSREMDAPSPEAAARWVGEARRLVDPRTGSPYLPPSRRDGRAGFR